MKNTKPSRPLLLATLVTLLAPAAWAQPAGAVNAANGAAANATTQRPAHTPSSSAGANAAAQGAANVANRPVSGNASVNGGANSAANVHAERTIQKGPKADVGVRNNASAQGQARGQVVSGAAHSAIAASLNSPETTGQLRQTGFEVRTAVLGAIDSRVETTEKSVDRLQRAARRTEGNAKDRANTAVDNVKAKEKAVRDSLKAARKASAAEWSTARERLAADYEAYAASVANAEASIGAADASGSVEGAVRN